MKRLLLAALSLLFLVNLTNAEPYKAPDIEGEPLKVTRQLYMDLQEFKSDKNFHKVGFADGSPKTRYRTWFEAYEGASKDPRYNKALIAKGVAFGDLYVLGKEYMKSGGKETDYSKFITVEFAKALNTK